MKPPKSILDKSFVYRNSAQTDVRKTWEEAMKRQEMEKQTKVCPIKRNPK